MNYIYSQSSSEVKNRTYGKYKASYNGCGPVCLYNLLVLLERNVPFDIVIRVLEKHLWFGGLFGTFSGNMKKALEHFECSYKSVKAESVNAITGERKIFVAHMNNGFMFFKGRHWVLFVTERDGKVTAFTGSKKDRPSEYSSFNDFCERYIRVGHGSIHRLYMIE